METGGGAAFASPSVIYGESIEDMVKVSCVKREYVNCPVCGSSELVAVEKENGHCGQCGTNISVDIVNKVMDNENEKEEFSQLSLFS